MKRTTASIAVLIFGMHSAHAQGSVQQPNNRFTAASLYAACMHSVSDAKTPQDHEYLEQFCTAYFRGLTDALFVMRSLADQRIPTCMSVKEAIGVQEARVIFQNWLKSHPSDATDFSWIGSDHVCRRRTQMRRLAVLRRKFRAPFLFSVAVVIILELSKKVDANHVVPDCCLPQ